MSRIEMSLAAMRSALGHWRRRAPELIVAAAFFASRHFYRARGVSFDASAAHNYVQIIPAELLRADLWRSLWYEHHQAPLLNALIGVGVRFGSRDATYAWLDGLFLALGLGAALAFIAALRRLGLGPAARTAAGVLFTLSPTAVLYESYLFYTHIVFCEMAFALFALLWFIERPTTRRGLCFFGCLFIAAMTRATYGLLWIAPIAVLLGLLRAAPWRVLVKAAAVPALVIAAHNLRTIPMTGKSFGYALIAPNLTEKILRALPPASRGKLVAEGVISPVTAVGDFKPLYEYHRYLPAHAPTGVPILDVETASDGHRNAANLDFIAIATIEMKDAKTLFRRYPGAYLAAVLHSFTDGYFTRASDDYCITPTRNAWLLAPYLRIENLALGGGAYGSGKDAWAGMVALWLYALWRVLGSRARRPSERSARIAAAFALATVLYAAAVTTLISYASFARYRFEVDALHAILLALLCADAARLSALLAASARRAWRSRRARPSAEPARGGSP